MLKKESIQAAHSGGNSRNPFREMERAIVPTGLCSSNASYPVFKTRNFSASANADRWLDNDYRVRLLIGSISRIFSKSAFAISDNCALCSLPDSMWPLIPVLRAILL
jgi:hypothetical protein